jgi:hypothetical protein
MFHSGKLAKGYACGRIVMGVMVSFGKIGRKVGDSIAGWALSDCCEWQVSKLF